ncbi:TetR/AcrR family transcriptional regulator [soil metagenome]
MAIDPRKRLDPERAEARREQILQAASVCFRRSGFHGASVADIAKVANLSAGHIYNYFDGKEAIIAAIVERNVGDFMEFFERVRLTPDIAAAMIEQVEAGVIDCTDPEKSSIQIEVLAEASRNPKIATLVRAVDDLIRSRIEELVASVTGLTDPSHVASRVQVMMAFFDGIMVRSLIEPALDREGITLVIKGVMAHLLTPVALRAPASAASASHP